MVYDLPFGKGKAFGSNWNGITSAVLGNWEVNGIVRLLSGFPIFIVANNNQSGVNFTNNNGSNENRPNRVCNGKLSNWTLNQFFNTSCFVDPPPGQLGNATRTPLFGPGFSNTDFAAIKNFPLPFREGMSLQFRAEFFNLFNHPQFFEPTNFTPYEDVDSAGFGLINSTVNNPRLIQFALKLRF